jgi:hypothetical protein
MAPLMRRYALPVAQCLLLQAAIVATGTLWLGWSSPLSSPSQASFRG